ncbi:MAG: exopolysaccharide biosynthesis polyprenyl glycosylphosphotransferase [Candidatus Latescibacteria bacterium]|nr:exopolysaccharide biosynthesis polyprenyl glycosylphosphotransferase [bacterium]MBD3424710.1 exopolysaccharide biosynthesis polyprenyl glycosylphosphotransferase [Candidatus Latescibacterota bacterium]
MSKDSLALDKANSSRGYNDRPGGLRDVSMEKTVLQASVKRILDILLSVPILILSLPFIIAVAIIIKCTSRGPVLFRQERIGRNGKPFMFLKLRTMKIGTSDRRHREFCKDFIKGSISSDRSGSKKRTYKIVDDPRITGVGKFLRKSSLDELPQFLNILKGDMSLVGPRPSLKYEYKYYNDWHKRRTAVKPGLTGLWQVSGRSNVSFQEMINLDLYYIENWSIILDIKIILRTVPVVLFGKGAY